MKIIRKRQFQFHGCIRTKVCLVNMTLTGEIKDLRDEIETVSNLRNILLVKQARTESGCEDDETKKKTLLVATYKKKLWRAIDTDIL